MNMSYYKMVHHVLAVVLVGSQLKSLPLKTDKAEASTTPMTGGVSYAAAKTAESKQPHDMEFYVFLKIVLGAGAEIIRQVKAFSVVLAEFHPQNRHCGRREWTPTSCPQTSTCVAPLHTI